MLLKIKSRKQAITNIKDIAGLILKLEKYYNIKTMKDIKTEKGIKNIDTKKIEQIRDTNEEKIKSMQKQYVELNKGLKQEKDKIETIEKLENISAKAKEKEKEQEQTKKKKKI